MYFYSLSYCLAMPVSVQRVVTSLRVLWDHLHALDNQYHPLEAANRIDRMLQVAILSP